ncbi:hypothetical protein CRUP_035818, partial [Coryphaenoides rupestris]
MAVFKSLYLRGAPSLDKVLIVRRMSLNLPPHRHNPFHDGEEEEETGIHSNARQWSPASSLLDGASPRDRNPFEDEEDENEANESKRGGGGGGARKGSFKFSPLKSLGKLGRNLRLSARSSPSPQGGPSPSPQGAPSPTQKKKRGRRSSEGSLLRFAGKCRGSLSGRGLSGEAGGEVNGCESEADSVSLRLSFMKKVVLEILELVKKRDLLLADSHILDLEQECSEATGDEAMSPGRSSDGGRRKAKDVELLYEALLAELWAVVTEALRSPTAGPNLGLVVQ